jgi:FkbM family methyltransferase
MMTDTIVQRKTGPLRKVARVAMRMTASFLPRDATMNGMPFIVWANEYIGRRILTTGSFEKDDLDRLADFVQPGDTCIDVGANIGVYTLALAKLTGPTGRVHAFEPVKRNAILVELNCALNHIDNVIVERAALSDVSGRALTATVPENDSAYSFFSESGGAAGDVTSLSLDSYCDMRGLGKIAFMKIDIEGAEFNALRGAAALLASARRPAVIMVEMVDAYLARFGTDVVSVCAWMAERGYTPHLVRDGRMIVTTADAINMENVYFRPVT